MTKFEKETRHQFYIFIKEGTTAKLAKCKTTAHALDAFCPLIQAWRVDCPFSCPITSMMLTLSNYCTNQAGDSDSSLGILLYIWWDTCKWYNPWCHLPSMLNLLLLCLSVRKLLVCMKIGIFIAMEKNKHLCYCFCISVLFLIVIFLPLYNSFCILFM